MGIDRETRCPKRLRTLRARVQITWMGLLCNLTSRKFSLLVSVSLTSGRLCQHLRQPNNLKYHDWIDECAQSLSQAAHCENDYLIPYFLRIQRFSEEVNHAFGYDTEFQLLRSDCVRTSILLRSFQHQYSQIEVEFPKEAWDSCENKLLLFWKCVLC